MGAVGGYYGTDESHRGSDRGTESTGTMAMDSENEQHPEPGGGIVRAEMICI